MKSKAIAKMVIDISMTFLLMLLMAFELIGRTAHEWIGMGMFALFVAHHILNGSWTKNLFRGKYNLFRTFMLIIDVLLLAAMIGLMISGILLSNHVFAFLGMHGSLSFARLLHMASSYWGFVLMSLHLGIHWGIMTGMAGKLFEQPSAARKWLARLAGFGIAAYGVWAFIKRDVLSYMLMQVHFVFFDYEEPVIFFILDYMAAMGLFVLIGHYLSRGLIKLGRKKK